MHGETWSETQDTKEKGIKKRVELKNENYYNALTYKKERTKEEN